MTWNDHDHRAEYAAAGHEHDYYDLAGVAKLHHRHRRLESEICGLREDLERALHRIRDLEDLVAGLGLLGLAAAAEEVPDPGPERDVPGLPAEAGQ